MFYHRETGEFFAATPGTQPDDDQDKEDKEQGSLLKEASRLAHSVSLIYLCDVRYTDSSSQVFDYDGADTDTGMDLSAFGAVQDSDRSASTVRSKWNAIASEPGPSNRGNQRRPHRSAIDEVLEEDEGDAAPSQEFGGATGEPDDTGMPDRTSISNGGASPGEARTRGNREVRIHKVFFLPPNVRTRPIT